MPTPSSQTDLFVVACEPSGDLLGAMLLKEFFRETLTFSVSGVCGQEMRKLPIESILNAEELSVMGFIDVARSFIKLAKHFYHVKKTILEQNPKVLLLIDAPSFNLKMAQALKKAGYQGTIIQYVCPTIWAWKKHRKKVMLESLDILVPLFPFEVDFFKGTSLRTYYFGHPLSERIGDGQKEERPIYITLFPGSRPSVIEKNLPLQLEMASLLARQTSSPIQIVAAGDKAREQLLAKGDPSIPIIDYENRYKAMRETKLALATSGTVTLELALCKVPTLVNYVIRPFDEWLATKVFKIDLPFYCIVNLLLNEEVYPEFYGSRFKASQYLAKAQEILLHGKTYETLERGCDKIQSLLTPANKNSFSNLLTSLLTR